MILNPDIHKIDLHMHTTVSDGTDTPEQLLSIVRSSGIQLFSVTDHDAVHGTERIREILGTDAPLFISGIEFSCRDSEGKYHILGYGYDAEAQPIHDIVELGHEIRIVKMAKRLKFLKEQANIQFSEEDIDELYKNENPGKPHLANLMVKYGYALSIKQAFRDVLNQINIADKQYMIPPREAIEAILKSGGIPVLAHPAFGSGKEQIRGREMDLRLQRLIGLGLQGLEAFYSGFSEELQMEMLDLAEKYGLYVTAGSDYHGGNKSIMPGETNLTDLKDAPDGLLRFLEEVPCRQIKAG